MSFDLSLRLSLAKESGPTMPKPIGELEQLKIVSVTYNNRDPDRYEAGTSIGIVGRKLPERMKVWFIYGVGEREFAWIEFDGGNRWIDKTFAAIVTVDEATPSEEERFRRCVSPETLKRLIERDGLT